MDPVHTPFPLPDYRGTSIVNLMRSLSLGLGHREDELTGAQAYPPLAALSPEAVAEYTNIVLLVIDGLGHEFLASHPDSFLRRHQLSRLSSVFPTTTATAITTYLTGLAPQQHGLTGWFMWLRELGSVAAVLPFRPRHGGPDYATRGIDPRAVFDWPALFDTLTATTTIVTQNALIDSPYSRATGGGAQRIGYRDMSGLFTGIQTTLANPPGPAEHRFIYAYWPGLDSLAHRTGIHSAEVAVHFQHLDAGVARLADALNDDNTLLLVCADHGFIDIAPRRTLQLDDHPHLARTLTLPLCGEPRTAYCYLRPGQTRTFEDYVRSELAELCTPFPSEQLIEEGWFGLGPPHPRLHERIGDYVLIMHEGAVIKDRLLGEAPFTLRGVHGGLSSGELYVPLIACQKKPSSAT